MKRVTLLSAIPAAFALNAVGLARPARAARRDDGAVKLFWYARLVGDGAPVFGVGARHRLAAASLIKLLIARVLVDAAQSGSAAWSDELRIARNDAVDGSPTFGNAAGQRASLHDLMFAMISQSDNTASNALLGHFGFDRCNAMAHEMGLAQTSVERRFYDWAAERRGRENRTSAHDAGELLSWFARNADARQSDAARVMRALYAQTDRESIPQALPGRRIANKTGELPGYRHDAAVVGEGEERYVVAALTQYTGARASAVAAIRRLALSVDARERAGISSGVSDARG